MPRRLLQTHQFMANIPQVSPSTLVHFSNSGKLLALASQDKILRIVDVAQGSIAQAIPNFGLASVSPDGRYVLGLSDKGEVNVVDLDVEGAAVIVRKLGAGMVQATVAPNSKQALVYNNKGYRLLNLDTGLPAFELGDVDGEPHFMFSPSGHRLITWGSNGSNLKLWDVAKGSRITSMSSHWKPVSFAKFSTDGNLLLTAAFDDRFVVWRTSDGEDLRRLTVVDKQPVPVAADFLADGKGLLLTFKTGRMSVWDIASGREETNADFQFAAKRVLFSKDRQKMFAGSVDGNVRVVDVASRSVVSLLSSMQLLGLTDDGKRLITQDTEGVRLMDASSYAPIARLPGQTDAFLSAKKRNLLVTSSADGKLTLWNVDKAEQVTQLKGHLDAVAQVHLSNDGQHILSVGNDRTLKLWGLPQVQDMANLVKDPFESTTEYMNRAKGWGSDFSMLVALGDYNADSELYAVKIGDAVVSVPLQREDARKLAGQRQAVLSTKLKFFDVEQLQLVNAKLLRLP
jgi:WD40 repeat protein